VFLELQSYLDVGLLLLRAITAVIFLSSGWSHVVQAQERSKSMGMSVPSTYLLGIVELLGGLSVLLGIYPQFGAILLIVVMLGAIYKKVAAWNTGFWGEKSMGWHYDLLLLIASMVILFSGGGAYRLV
jgi:putative oxidoreductase